MAVKIDSHRSILASLNLCLIQRGYLNPILSHFSGLPSFTSAIMALYCSYPRVMQDKLVYGFVISKVKFSALPGSQKILTEKTLHLVCFQNWA